MPVIQQYNYNDLRNFSYLIYCSKSNITAIIDPFDGFRTKEIIEENQLIPKYIINTHNHWDHIQGNEFLTDSYDLEVIYQKGFEQDFEGITKTVNEGDLLEIGDEHILEFQRSPGHTESHLAIFLKDSLNSSIKAVFSGDTLFNAGVGNCRNGGNVHDLYKTVVNIYDELDDEVIVYPGHDYLLNNLKFSKSVSESDDICTILKEKSQEIKDYNEQPLSMAVERKINLFLKEKREQLKNHPDFAKNKDEQIFIKLRQLRDKW